MLDIYRIIIAEDETSLALMLTRLIVRYYPTALVQAFANGNEALAGYTQTRADLLFVNHSMPGMDGPMLVRIIRARGDAVPIIGISGDPFVRDMYLAAGADTFIEGVDLIKQLPALLQRFLPPLQEATINV